MSYNLTLINADTDSITVCKADQSPLSEEESSNLLKELNSLFPEKIVWADDGKFEKVIVFKAKNYVLWDGKKLKTKGSALRSGNRETALREFINETVACILNHED